MFWIVKLNELWFAQDSPASVLSCMPKLLNSSGDTGWTKTLTSSACVRCDKYDDKPLPQSPVSFVGGNSFTANNTYRYSTWPTRHPRLARLPRLTVIRSPSVLVVIVRDDHAVSMLTTRVNMDVPNNILYVTVLLCCTPSIVSLDLCSVVIQSWIIMNVQLEIIGAAYSRRSTAPTWFCI